MKFALTDNIQKHTHFRDLITAPGSNAEASCNNVKSIKSATGHVHIMRSVAERDRGSP
jgi:hypothetical protein